MRAILCCLFLCLTAGCASTTTGDPVWTLRPKDTNKIGESTAKYTGNADVVVSFPNLDDFGTTEFKSAESAGFRISARPRNWYVAPELGMMITDEAEGDVELNSTELYLGGRVQAALVELPFTVYASGGLSYLDSEVGPNDDTSTGYYLGIGGYATFGDDHGITAGIGYRLVDQDWELNEWSEVLFSLGFSW